MVEFVCVNKFKPDQNQEEHDGEITMIKNIVYCENCAREIFEQENKKRKDIQELMKRIRDDKGPIDPELMEVRS